MDPLDPTRNFSVSMSASQHTDLAVRLAGLSQRLQQLQGIKVTSPFDGRSSEKDTETLFEFDARMSFQRCLKLSEEQNVLLNQILHAMK